MDLNNVISITYGSNNQDVIRILKDNETVWEKNTKKEASIDGSYTNISS